MSSGSSNVFDESHHPTKSTKTDKGTHVTNVTKTVPEMSQFDKQIKLKFILQESGLDSASQIKTYNKIEELLGWS